MITVSLCCNDPDNGMPLGRVCAIEIGDNEFEAPDGGFFGGGNKLRIGLAKPFRSPSRCNQAFKISRRIFPCCGWTSWYGNWCWDATRMTGVDVLQLIRYLREIGWKMTAGGIELGDAFDSGADITAELVQEAA
jgi:hypothetical protein